MEYLWISLLVFLLIVLIIGLFFNIKKRLNIKKKINKVINEIKETENDQYFKTIDNQLVLELNSINYHLLFIPSKPHYEISFNSPTTIQMFTRGRNKIVKLNNSYKHLDSNNINYLLILLDNEGPYKRWINESDLEIIASGASFWNMTIASNNYVIDVINKLKIE